MGHGRAKNNVAVGHISGRFAYFSTLAGHRERLTDSSQAHTHAHAHTHAQTEA